MNGLLGKPSPSVQNQNNEELNNDKFWSFALEEFPLI
jgi:hypothetical protein